MPLKHGDLKKLALPVLFCGILAGAQSAPVGTADTPYPQAHLETPHYKITVESDTPGALAPYYPQIESALEYGWRRYQTYTGYDLNRLANAAPSGGFERPKYVYEILNPSDMWTKGWGGGLTAWNHSQMGNELVPDLTPQKAAQNSTALGILWHELANGWANVFTDYKGQDTHLPLWWASEGQAGFLKHHALTDSGYRTAAETEYKGAVTAYDQYIADKKAGNLSKADPGAITHVLLESLWQKYGWVPIRTIDHQVQTGKLLFAKDTPEDEKNGQMAFVLSNAVHQDLLPFLEANQLPIATHWSERIAALHLPAAQVPIAHDLSADRADPHAGTPFKE